MKLNIRDNSTQCILSKLILNRNEACQKENYNYIESNFIENVFLRTLIELHQLGNYDTSIETSKFNYVIYSISVKKKNKASHVLSIEEDADENKINIILLEKYKSGVLKSVKRSGIIEYRYSDTIEDVKTSLMDLIQQFLK